MSEKISMRKNYYKSKKDHSAFVEQMKKEACIENVSSVSNVENETGECSLHNASSVSDVEPESRKCSSCSASSVTEAELQSGKCSACNASFVTDAALESGMCLSPNASHVSDAEPETGQCTGYSMESCVSSEESVCNSFSNNSHSALSDNEELVVNEKEKSSLIQNLKKWGVEHNVTLVCFKSLLDMLREYHDLPKDPRTILQTNTMNSVVIGDGNFIYFGIAHHLASMLTKNYSNNVELSINIDGVPLYKSSGASFWPILCAVNISNFSKPFIVAIYCGKKKPDINLYLEQFCLELEHLMTEGLMVHGKVFKPSVRAIIADAPAKAFIKQIKTHGAYFACDRCMIKGIYDKK